MAKWFLMVFALVFVAGCATTATEEDRQSIDMAAQINDVTDDELDRLEQAKAEDPVVAQHAAKLRALNEDSRKLHTGLQEVFGLPKVRLTYSQEQVDKLLAAQKKSHEKGFWGALGAGLLAGVTFVLSVARKFGPLLPGIGPIFGVADSLMGGIEATMAKFKANQNMEALDELKRTLIDVQNKDPRVRAWITANLDRIKQKYGLDLQEILEAGLPSTPPPPAAPTA